MTVDVSQLGEHQPGDENFVHVDEDGDVIRVYTAYGSEPYCEFSNSSQKTRRERALAYAKRVAQELGCDYGENWR